MENVVSEGMRGEVLHDAAETGVFIARGIAELLHEGDIVELVAAQENPCNLHNAGLDLEALFDDI